MLMKCKTCEKEFKPPRKNVLNCSKCVLFKKAKNKPEEERVKEESEREQNENGESEGDEKMRMQKNIEHKQPKKNNSQAVK